MYCIIHHQYQCYLNNLFRVVSAAQLVAITEDAVLGSVAKVVSKNPSWDEHLSAKLTYLRERKGETSSIKIPHMS